MSAAGSPYRSTVAKKAVMAVTGMVLFVFVVVHMLGNLKIYYGETKFNDYGRFLRTMGAPVLGNGQALWTLRIILLAAAGFHVATAVDLARRSLGGRPERYAVRHARRATYAARTMRWSGVIILFFVVYHLAHFTFGKVGYADGEFADMQIYRNVVNGFSHVPVAAFYIAAMVVLGFHLAHGIWSFFQTLGWNGPRSDRRLRVIAYGLAGLIVAGNCSIPVSVLLHVVK